MGSIGIRASEVKGATMNVNDAEIYYEVRGSGPPMLFIQGATGDGGTFERVANLLADEFTLLTYHRRGNSLSPPPAGWTSTSTEEQADDAVTLLEALSLSPAAVFGTSSGAIIGLDLVICHPEAVRGGILHEPPLMSVLARPEEVMGPTQQMVEEAMKRSIKRGTRDYSPRLPRLRLPQKTKEGIDNIVVFHSASRCLRLVGIIVHTWTMERPCAAGL